MKHLLKKISYSRSKVIGHVKIKDDSLAILSENSSVRYILNGCEVFTGPLREASKDVNTSVIASLVAVLKSDDDSKLSFYSGDWKSAPDHYLEKTVNYIKASIDENKFSVYKKATDAKNMEKALNIDVAMPTDIQEADKVIKNNTVVLCSIMRDAMRVLQKALDHGTLLCRKKLVPSMWGAKDTQKFINEIKYQIIDNKCLWSQMEILYVTMTKAVNRLVIKLNENLKENAQFITEVIIPDIIKCYEDMKTIIVKAVTILTPLIYVDDIFHKNTTYPATWFFTEEVLDGLREEYNKLIKFLTQIPVIETKVIYPLDFYKLQISY